ncbi:MAG: 50S ribosomal protein L23 [Candidatus Woesearchaeota archaeon]|jgi:large subunit ribosomal protein L23|nr:50S ribosomal protein L23 [Candidatus Woesearchaeota archaeon]|tara:strand:- start:15284 stop:15544 length:261 start_codon:yes stop_codon:yes gene_type:complete
MDPYNIIKYPLSTEKSIRLMEAENKLIFVVNKKATKKEIKKAIEEMFKVEVNSVNTFVNHDGEKRAYIKFSLKNPAIDIATQMGLM